MQTQFGTDYGNITVPPKVRVFWRRVIQDLMPSRENLRRRHVEKIGLCEDWAQKDTTFHKLFWMVIKVLAGIKLLYLHPITWAKDLLDEQFCDKKDACIILCGMWALWSSRNARRHGKPPVSTKQ